MCSSGVPRKGVGCAVAHTRDVDHLEGVCNANIISYYNDTEPAMTEDDSATTECNHVTIM